VVKSIFHLQQQLKFSSPQKVINRSIDEVALVAKANKKLTFAEERHPGAQGT